MKRVVLVLASLLCIDAQTVTLGGPASAKIGGTEVMNIGLYGGASQVAALQWALRVPAGYQITFPLPSSTSAAAGKTAVCGPTICLVAGPTLTALPDGTVATVALQIPASAAPGTIKVWLSDTLAATPQGYSTPVGPGKAFAIKLVRKK